MTPVTVETWAWIGQVVIYGGTLAGALTAISALVKKIRSRTTTAKLEVQVSKHEEWLHNDNERLNRLEHEISESQRDRRDLHDLCRMNLIASQALLKSMLEGGNNHKDMQDVYDQIHKYLNDRI